MKFTLQTLPLSTNALYRGRRFLTDKGKRNKTAIAFETKAEISGGVFEKISGPVCLEISLFWHDARKRDVDNIKALLDSFTGILYDDDGQVERLVVTKSVDRGNPRVEVEVKAL